MLNRLVKSRLQSRFSQPKFSDKPTGNIVHIYQLLTNNTKVKVSSRATLVNCCFHQEDTPSLALYPDTSSYNCFGCQKHGDIYTLVEEILGCSFKEALQFIKDNQ